MIETKRRSDDATKRRPESAVGGKPHLSPRRCGYPRSGRAFSLIEVLLAIFILGIGVIGIAALFPAGIAQQKRSVDDIMGPIVADNAMAILRSKLSQDDFGSYEDFGFNFAPEFAQMFGVVGQPLYTSGDWLWRRPGMMFADDSSTASRDERGAIDVFSGSASLGSVPHASENPHIPFNPVKWGGTGASKPVVVFTRGERMYPMSDRVRNVGIEDTPQYYWDCMFRRSEGRILVAVFVYRVTVPAGEHYVYSPPRNPDPSLADVPFIPFQRDFVDVTSAMPWNNALDSSEYSVNAFGNDYSHTELPQTDPELPGAPFASLGVADSNPILPAQSSWQSTGQWFIDQNAGIHRVLVGRDKESQRDHPVELVDTIHPLPQPNAYSGHSVYFYDRGPQGGATWVGGENVITNIWYIPRYVDVDLDGNGSTDLTISLTPVFATVEEL